MLVFNPALPRWRGLYGRSPAAYQTYLVAFVAANISIPGLHSPTSSIVNDLIPLLVNFSRFFFVRYRYARYQYGYRTEHTEVSGTSIDVPNLPKCPVPVLVSLPKCPVIDVVPNSPKCPAPVLMSDRTYRNVRYRY